MAEISDNPLSVIILMARHDPSLTAQATGQFHATDPIGDGLTALWKSNEHIAAATLDRIIDHFSPKHGEENVLAGVRFAIKDPAVSAALIDYWKANRGSF